MLRSLFVFCIVLWGVYGTARSAFGALLFYLWFALFRPQEWLWVDISGYRPSLVVGLLLVVRCLISGVLPNVSHVLSLGSVGFLATALLAQSNAVDAGLGWEWVKYLTELIFVALFLIALTDTKRRFLWSIATVAGSFGFYTAKAGLASVLGGGVRYYAGLGGAFSDNNGYALGAAMVLPLLLGAAQNLRQEPGGWKWVAAAFYAAVPLTAVTIVSTFSRGAVLGLASSLAVYILLQRRRLAASLVLAAVVVVGTLTVPVPEGYFNRVETIGRHEQLEDKSALGRLHFWRVAVLMAGRNPLGVGLRNFDANYDRFDTLNGAYGRARSVHSSHFEALAETGFDGALVWAMLFVLSFVTLRRIRQRAELPGVAEVDRRFMLTMSNSLAASMVAFLVGGSFVALMLNDLTWLTFSLVAALDLLTRRMVLGGANAVDAAPAA